MPASWASTILLCAGFAVLSLRQTKYIISDDIDDLKGRSGGRRHLPRTDDAYADDDDLSSDHGGIIASEDVDGDDDRPGDDIHEYDALGGMADFIQPEDGAIRSISLLGERNSGTRWIYGRVVFFCSPSCRRRRQYNNNVPFHPPRKNDHDTHTHTPPISMSIIVSFPPVLRPPPRVTFHYVYIIYCHPPAAFFR